MAVCGVVSTLVLAALATGAAPPFREKGWREPVPIPVVIRTSDNVYAGTDLRYENGVFHLRDGKDEVAVDEAKVARISFLGLGREASRGRTTVWLAANLIARKHEMPSQLHLAEGVFILPGESAVETFRWVTHKLHQPDALAVLCVELVTACVKERRPDQALAEIERAERESSAEPYRAFVFGLMRAAALHDQGRTKELEAALAQLRTRYPEHAAEIPPFDRPFSPRPKAP